MLLLLSCLLQAWRTEGACGVISCTPAVQQRLAGGSACFSRILWLMDTRGFSEAAACQQVGVVEWPIECGDCSPTASATPAVAPPTERWVAPGGRSNGACRTASGGAGTYHLPQVGVWGSTLESCRAACAAECSCVAFEFQTVDNKYSVCEMHAEQVTHSVPVGRPSVCFAKRASPSCPPVAARNVWIPSLAQEVAARLNFRFANGHPSSNLSEAGVLTHQIDDSKPSGAASEQTPEWMACRVGECARWSGRLSASLSNAQLPWIYSTTQPGFARSLATSHGAQNPPHSGGHGAT